MSWLLICLSSFAKIPRIFAVIRLVRASEGEESLLGDGARQQVTAKEGRVSAV